MLINPIVNGLEAFLAIFNCLPFSIRAFISLALGTSAVVVVVNLIRGR